MKVELLPVSDLSSGTVRTRRTWLRTEKKSLQVIRQVLLVLQQEPQSHHTVLYSGGALAVLVVGVGDLRFTFIAEKSPQILHHLKHHPHHHLNN